MKEPPWLPYAGLVFCVASLAVGQILFKLVSLQIKSLYDLSGNVRAAALLAGAFALYAASTATWVMVLQKLPLSHAYLFMSFGFFLVPLLSFLILGEPITTRFMIGTATIIVGVILAAT